MCSERRGIDMANAFDALHWYARAHNMKIAEAVTQGSLLVNELTAPQSSPESGR